MFLEDKEEVFHQFEDLAIPIIAKYNGRLMIRLRPDNGTVIERNIETPYEIHLIEFNSESDFNNFMEDTERKRFLYLKEDSIKSSILIKGERSS